GAGMCWHAGIDDASDHFYSTRRLHRICWRAARCLAKRRTTVLRSRPPARRTRSSAPLLAGTDQAGIGRKDQPRQGFRSNSASGSGGGGLSCHGRAPRHQDALAPEWNEVVSVPIRTLRKISAWTIHWTLTERWHLSLALRQVWD